MENTAPPEKAIRTGRATLTLTLNFCDLHIVNQLRHGKILQFPKFLTKLSPSVFFIFTKTIRVYYFFITFVIIKFKSPNSKFKVTMKLVFITGAGMSKESGIDTFRDSDGLWEKYPVMDVASIEGYYRNPELVLKFYNERRRDLLNCKPNEGHRLVAELEKRFEVTVVTQNIDNLHEQAGSKHVIHLHGELMKATSSYSPNDPRYIESIGPEKPTIEIGDKAKDGSQLRPFIVWFGEAVPMIEPAAEEVMTADIVVIIGTSLQVYPAAGLINYASPDAKIYLIDPNPVRANTLHRIHVIQKGASEGMRELITLLP